VIASTLATLVAVTTWLTPQPQWSMGLLVNYGAQQTVEDQAWFRGYDLRPYRQRCGISAMSPAHLGRIAWVRVSDRPWFGPCLVLDTSARHHFWRNVYVNGEVAEVPRWLARRLGFETGVQGQVWFGACPPPTEDWETPRIYRPPLVFDWSGERHPIWRQYPRQQRPQQCAALPYQ